MASQALHGTPTDANNKLGPTIFRVLTLCNSTYEYTGLLNVPKVIMLQESNGCNRKRAAKIPIRRMGVTFFAI